MRRSLPIALFAIAGLWGCTCDSDDDRPAAPRPEPVSEECREAAARVERAFRRPEDATLFAGYDPAPLAHSGLELVPNHPKIVVTADGDAIDGVDVRGEGAPAAIAAEIEMQAAMWGQGMHGVGSGEWPNAVTLYVPNHTPLSHVRVALAELDPTLRLDLVVQQTGGDSEEPNPPTWLEAELVRMRSERTLEARRARFRTLFDRATGECTAARAHTPFLFGRDPSVPAQAEPTTSLSGALVECRCAGVDVDAMVAIGIFTGPPNRHPLRGISFTRVTEPTEGAITTEDELTIEWLVTQLERNEPPRRVHFAP